MHVYIVVHLDQPSEQVAVQASHAALEAGSHFLRPTDPTPSIALLAVASEADLVDLHAALETAGIPCRMFFEPDFAPLRRGSPGHFTALATAPIDDQDRLAFAHLRPLRFRKGVAR